MTLYIVEADWTWTGTTFVEGVRIAVGEDGRIAEVGTDAAPTRRLTDRALLPGLISAHSHAFQRGLRGRGERFPEGVGSFWTWREAMYQLVDSLDRERFHALAASAFREMRAAGITTIGEFHYLHHSATGADFAFDEAILAAARDAGIRIVVLSAYYRTGGIGKPLGPAQQRFATASPEEYWAQMDRLAARLDPKREQLGAAVHSVRAASLEDLAAVHGEAVRRGLVFHMHLEEQRQEIEECLAAYHKRPMALVNEILDVDGNFTAVHGTHTIVDDLAEFLEAGGRLCVCPLTEANLGDGIPHLSWPGDGAERISLGTDSNARVSMIEEMRWLEYGQRLRTETRGALANDDGWAARQLLNAATVSGAAALGVAAGRIAPGLWADFCTVDLSHPTLHHIAPEDLLDAIVFGSGNEVMAESCVGGAWG